MQGNRTTYRKAQSAMEYLMTYGWAILIIAVVLGALFSLGVFSGSSLLGTSCVASPGYLCSNPTLLTTGLISFTFGQNTGSSIYNIQLACAATANSAGYPNNAQAFNVISTTGAAQGLWLPSGTAPGGASVGGNTLLTLTSGQTVAVSGLMCFGTTATFVGGSLPIGQTFSGYIWMNYTTGAANAASNLVGSSTNPWYTVKVATVTLKVV